MDESSRASLRPGGPTRFQLAVVLLAMFSAIIAGKLLEDSLVDRLRQDSASLFDDRLIPATTLFHLGDQMHSRRHLLEDYFGDVPGVDAKRVQYDIGQSDARLAELIGQFEQTYLVEEESRHLVDLRTTIADYQALEQRLIERKEAGAEVEGRAALAADFERVKRTLLELTAVQERVGAELRADSVANASSMTSLLYFQLGIAFVLGLIAAGLATSLARPARPLPRWPPRRPRRRPE